MRARAAKAASAEARGSKITARRCLDPRGRHQAAFSAIKPRFLEVSSFNEMMYKES